MQVPMVMYVDDVEQSAPSLRRLIGDNLIVLEDSTHFMRRYLATIPDSHPLKGMYSMHCNLTSRTIVTGVDPSFQSLQGNLLPCFLAASLTSISLTRMRW